MHLAGYPCACLEVADGIEYRTTLVLSSEDGTDCYLENLAQHM